jgi:oligopeptide transport system substrate-binding protein
VFAWRRNLDPHGDNPLSEQLYPIAGAQTYHQGQSADPHSIGVHAVDDHTLDVTLAEPVAHLLYLMADPIAFPLPAHVLQQRGEQAFQPEVFVGNGPFLPAAWQAGRYLELRRNTRHRRRIGNLERARLVFGTPGDDLRRRRSLDMLRCEDRPELIRQHQGVVVSLQYLDTYMLAFGCAAAPFRDVAYRKAFAMAIDQEYLAQHVWQGLQQQATGGVVPPGVPGHSPGIGLPFDPAAARALLASVPAVRMPLRMACLPGLGATPAVLQAAWQTHLGVEVQVAADLAVDELLEGLRHGRYHMAIFGWNMEFPDASDILQPLFGSGSPLNYVGWGDAAFDALLAQSRRQRRPLDRFECYHRADTLLVAEQAVVVPLYHSRTFALFKPGFALADGARVVRGGRLPLGQIVCDAG